MKAAPRYRDRRQAGEILGAHVKAQVNAAEAVVLALPRGGVPVGLEVARSLRAELDVFPVRKLGAPGFEEYAIGAIAAGGFEILNETAIAELGVSEKEIAAVAEREATELRRRERLYRADHPPVAVSERAVVLVDDGLATGFTLRAAIAALRAQQPRQLVVAVPVGAPDTCAEIEREVDLLICPFQPEPFRAVGLWYQDFTPTADEEVCECLRAAAAEHGRPRSSPARTA